MNVHIWLVYLILNLPLVLFVLILAFCFLLFIICIKKFIEVDLHVVVLVPGVHQSDSVIYTYIYSFFHINIPFWYSFPL